VSASPTEASRTVTTALTLASPAMDFEHVLVAGAGQMGAGIAQVVAGSGRGVSLYDAAP
jgi:S-adenosylhomocysteine hydrolase